MSTPKSTVKEPKSQEVATWLAEALRALGTLDFGSWTLANGLSRLLPLVAFFLTGCLGQRLAAADDPAGAQAKAKPAAELEAKRPEEDKEGGPALLWNWLMRPRDWFESKPPAGAGETLILRNGKLVPDSASENKAHAELASAHELYRRAVTEEDKDPRAAQKDYQAAENIFNRIADNTKNAPSVAEEARFYEAECLRRQSRYPRACDTYHKTVLDFPSGAFREQAVQRMFDIANYWLEDTRREMRLDEEKRQGKRWLVITPIVHFEQAKPFLDQEGRAIEALERVRLNDLSGPLADKALYYCGAVRLFREDYRDADMYFTQLVEMHPNSELAPKAVELGIIAKHLSTGGSDYDGRKVAEARQLINAGLRNYPTLAHNREKQEFLTRQLLSCTLQQAEKDFKIAEFYRRTGHPGSAYFYYEIVRRRYPGTKYADQAVHKMQELYAAAQQEKKKVPPVPEGKGPEKAPPPKRLPPAGPAPVETAPPPRPVPPGGVPRLPQTTPLPR